MRSIGPRPGARSADCRRAHAAGPVDFILSDGGLRRAQSRINGQANKTVRVQAGVSADFVLSL